jgi:hypothetical protein
MTFLKSARSQCCVVVHCLSKEKTIKTIFLTSFFMSHRRAVMLLLSDTKTTHFFLKLLTVPRPMNARKCWCTFCSCSRDYVMFQCLAIDVQLQNFATLQKTLLLCTQMTLFFSIVGC